MTFVSYGISAFDVQYWNGSGWVTVPGGSVTGNDKVWRKFTFSPIMTSKIRVMVNNALASYSRIIEVEAWGMATAAATNMALSTNGAGGTASSTYNSNYPASSTINGDRKGLNWNNGGGWNDGTASSYPDWLQIDFNGSKAINEIDVFTLQDNPASPAEPTETMTFASYGITAFDVQYWNGSGWVTVPGGSITGNNKVWRKLSFSPITTTKIRVLINASVDGYSRITEVEAWGYSSGLANINWLVTDQLGTPRMVLDKAGSLAAVKRHDYLPFGEELYAAQGGRTTGLGYSVDTIRQKFTAYERDSETGLDYAQARYYSGTQGRFSSSDPLMASAQPANPQTWNRYSYVLNKPLRLVDPSGLEACWYASCSGTDESTDGLIGLPSDEPSEETEPQNPATAEQIVQSDINVEARYGEAVKLLGISPAPGMEMTKNILAASIEEGADATLIAANMAKENAGFEMRPGSHGRWDKNTKKYIGADVGPMQIANNDVYATPDFTKGLKNPFGTFTTQTGVQFNGSPQDNIRLGARVLNETLSRAKGPDPRADASGLYRRGRREGTYFTRYTEFQKLAPGYDRFFRYIRTGK